VTKSVINLAKLKQVSGFASFSSFLQSIKDTETGFVKLRLTCETVLGDDFICETGSHSLVVCLLVQVETKIQLNLINITQEHAVAT